VRGRQQEICSAMVLNSPAVNNYVTVQAFNLASLRSKGFDIETAYRMNLEALGLPGRLTFRALATRMSSFLTDPGRGRHDPVGRRRRQPGRTPKWKLLASQAWDTDKLRPDPDRALDQRRRLQQRVHRVPDQLPGLDHDPSDHLRQPDEGRDLSRPRRQLQGQCED
jgi:hypothetical protein